MSARLYISAAHKSSGKTTISLGLSRALSQRLSLQTFKKGPDYIDPLWLSQATAKPCFNLDFYTQSAAEIQQLFQLKGKPADLCLIEGNKGLYDGLDIDGANSNAALAELLTTPVILVIDTSGMTRGLAPLLLGYLDFANNIDIAGVILNKVASDRHETKLREVIEHYCHLPVLGAIRKDSRLEISERHLGLVPSNESKRSEQHIQLISEIVAQQVDLERIVQIARAARPLPVFEVAASGAVSGSLRIGIVRDEAFGFYYADDLERFQQQGVELVFFSCVHDAEIPSVDALFLGGGFPETSMQALSANASMLQSMRDFVASGKAVYAECGGLMYLCRQISWQGESLPMAAVIPADAQMHERPQGRGYVRLQPSGNFPWPVAAQVLPDTTVQAHEFHYSSLENIDPSLQYAWKMQRGHGINGQFDGIILHNVFASYSHLRANDAFDWVAGFVQFARQCRDTALANQIRENTNV